MKCSACLVGEMAVKDSRASADDLTVRRRRYCENCGHRQTTVEVAIDESVRGISRGPISRTTELVDVIAGLEAPDQTMLIDLARRLSHASGGLSVRPTERSVIRAASDIAREENLIEPWPQRKARRARERAGAGA
jgi:hypothetical protein